MTPLTEILRDRIHAHGPIPFRDFMRAALYHPEHGYYRRKREVFGTGGDYFTAEQLQPVFGILMASSLRALRREMGDPDDFTVVELGAGRGEMADAFSGFHYVPVDLERGAIPRKFRGVVFSNEFFDALPVDTVTMRGGAPVEMRVAWRGERFAWVDGSRAPAAVEAYLGEFLPPLEEGCTAEVSLDALAWLDRIAASLEDGFALTIDYGCVREEMKRFPRGTLMSYHLHHADEDVLDSPGERDITAHVNFTALEEHGRRCGLRTVRRQTLARTLLDAGEPDRFAAALDGPPERRLQLKTLLFGMGETFLTLLQRRV